jgi:hypothetical protein
MPNALQGFGSTKRSSLTGWGLYRTESASGRQRLIGKQNGVNTYFVSQSVGMRAKRAYSKMKNTAQDYSGGFHFASALPIGLENSRAGGYSMSLDFFATFLVKQKSREKKTIFTTQLKQWI